MLDLRPTFSSTSQVRACVCVGCKIRFAHHDPHFDPRDTQPQNLKPNQTSAFNLLSWKTRACIYLPRCIGTASGIGWSGCSCQRIQSTIDTAKRDSHLRQSGEADANTRMLPISQSNKQQPCLLSVCLQIQRVPFFSFSTGRAFIHQLDFFLKQRERVATCDLRLAHERNDWLKQSPCCMAFAGGDGRKVQQLQSASSKRARVPDFRSPG